MTNRNVNIAEELKKLKIEEKEEQEKSVSFIVSRPVEFPFYIFYFIQTIYIKI